MYAKIGIIESLSYELRYQERKVKAGRAQCLYADNFIKEAAELTKREKLLYLQRLTSLNELSHKVILHIIFSWPAEEQLSDEKMTRVVRDYMKRMEFDHQPWLLYRHRDTANPHAHLISTNIQKNGERDSLAPWDYTHSRVITRELEAEYGLLGPKPRLPDEEWRRLRPVQKIVIGQTPLRSTFTRVLEHVIGQYRYSNLEELNAVLRLYNIKADRGREGTKLYQNRGLVYRALQPDGKEAYTYFKASFFPFMPTLKNLERRFEQNLSLREQHRQHLATTIDWAFYQKKPSEEVLRRLLQKEKISMVLQPVVGGAREVYYVDLHHRVVFDGRTLGAPYTLESLRRRCMPDEEYQRQLIQGQRQQQVLKQRPGQLPGNDFLTF